MKKVGSLLAIVVLLGAVALAWQSQGVAGTAKSGDSAIATKGDSCCPKTKQSTKTEESTASAQLAADAGKSSGCGLTGKTESAAKSGGCPFSAAASTRPAAVTADEKGAGCSMSGASLAAYTADSKEGKTCSKQDKAGCEKKCGKEGERRCDKDGVKCCEKDGVKCCEKSDCPKAAECAKKSEGSACNKPCAEKAELASAKVGCSMAATTRPALAADAGCVKVTLASDGDEKPACGGKKGCGKDKDKSVTTEKTSLVSATQPAIVPAAMPAGQSSGCSKSCGHGKTSLVSAGAEAQPVAQ